MADKAKIIILMHYMELGGAEMALIGLLQSLNPSMVDADLFIYSHQGPMMKFIPQWINLIQEVGAYAVIERPICEAVKKRHFGVAIGRVMAKLQFRRFRKKQPAIGCDEAILQYVGDYVTPHLPGINPDKEYDLCISFLTPHNIGRDKVKAKRRLAWIHTDYSTVDIDVARELPVWGSYDYIASISEEVTKAFVGRFPSLASKIIQIENILPAAYVRQRAEEIDVSSEFTGGINLLSVGRFCTAKNYDNVPDIAGRLVARGLTDLRWYIIGYGGDEDLIRRKIVEAGMQEHVILLGKKENPYPYIRACDIYVQPSRYEGKSVTVREAQILCKPIVVTNYPTASSQITDGIDGKIVPLDNEGCARGIAEFIVKKELQQKIVANLRNGDYANESEVEKIYNLLR